MRSPISVGLALASCLLLGHVDTGSRCTAHDGADHTHAVRAVQPAEHYAPSPIPDRIVLTWSDDPTTTQSVSWRTSTEVAIGKAELALATHGPEFVQSKTSIDAQSVALKTDLSTAHYHSVTFRGLLPATLYLYRVGDGTNWSEWFQFRTAPAVQEPFSFVYFGDAQNELRSMWSRVIREASRDAPRARFFLHAGDLVNKAQSDAEWGEWFEAGGWLHATIPSVPVVGNHEQHKIDEARRQLTHHWRPQFDLPEHGPEGLEETCYTFVYSNARFVVLNSNVKLSVQAQWLEEVLQKNTHPWVVCAFHHPIFSTANERDNPILRAAWKPILDRYRVDLVLQGHDHSYGRTGLETPSEPPPTDANVAAGSAHRDPHHGTVYVVSVSGPKMYKLDPKPFLTRVGEDTQLYQVIRIDGDRLTYEARTATGDLYDAFELVKTDGGVNRLSESQELMPARRRPSP